MTKGPGEFSKSLGLPGVDIVGSVERGIRMGRTFSSWRYRKKLETEGYDPLTIEAAVEAVKAGRNPEPILYRAQEAYRVREEQAALRASPPPVHGSAAWAQQHEIQEAGLLRPASASGIALGRFNDQHVSWDGESHL